MALAPTDVMPMDLAFSRQLSDVLSLKTPMTPVNFRSCLIQRKSIVMRLTRGYYQILEASCINSHKGGVVFYIDMGDGGVKWNQFITDEQFIGGGFRVHKGHYFVIRKVTKERALVDVKNPKVQMTFCVKESATMRVRGPIPKIDLLEAALSVCEDETVLVDYTIRVKPA